MRNVAFSILVSMVLLVSGCSKDKIPMASIRFKNIMTDLYEFPYGMKFGDAIYGGSLGNNDITPYLETNPGTYSILAKRVDGEWLVISVGKFTVEPAKKYTILIFGTVQGFSFQLQDD
jgi:hypothetical protein